jgi:hypothetical protein
LDEINKKVDVYIWHNPTKDNSNMIELKKKVRYIIDKIDNNKYLSNNYDKCKEIYDKLNEYMRTTICISNNNIIKEYTDKATAYIHNLTIVPAAAQEVTTIKLDNVYKKFEYIPKELPANLDDWYSQYYLDDRSIFNDYYPYVYRDDYRDPVMIYDHDLESRHAEYTDLYTRYEMVKYIGTDLNDIPARLRLLGRVYDKQEGYINHIGTIMNPYGYIEVDNTDPTANMDLSKPLSSKDIISDYLFMNKYFLLKCLYNELLQYLDRDTAGNGPNTMNNQIPDIRTSIEKINKIIFNKATPYDYKIIQSIILNYVNKILNNFIDELLTQIVNDIIILNYPTLTTQRSTQRSTQRPTVYNTDLQQTFMRTMNSEMELTFDIGENINDLIKTYDSKYNFTNQFLNDVMIGDLYDIVDKDETIHRLQNYNLDTNINSTICYKINMKIIELLIAGGININSKDMLGRTPIYYAIDILYYDLIEKLKNKGAGITGKKLNDKYGDDPKQYTLKKYDKLIKHNLNDKNKICKIITDSLLTKMKTADKKFEKVPRFTKILCNLALYLLNHQILLIGRKYQHGWTYDLNSELEKLLNITNDTIVPLLKSEKEINDFVQYEMALNENEYLKSTVKKIDIEIIDLTEQLANLSKRSGSLLRQKDKDLTDKNIGIKSKKKKELEEKKKKLSRKIADITAALNDDKIKTKLGKFDKIKSDYKYRDNVSKLYDSIFAKVTNHGKDKYDYYTDFNTYNIMWYNYLSKTDVDDNTQIIDKLMKKQRSITYDKTNIQIFDKYYECVIDPFISDYFDLPQEYDNETNYALVIIIDILIHIIKRFIIPNMYFAIKKLIIKYLINIDPPSEYNKKDYRENIQKKLKEIIDGPIKSRGDGKQPLLNYLFVDVPVLIVKTTTNIYEYSSDPAKQSKATIKTDIFNIITDIINASSVKTSRSSIDPAKELDKFLNDNLEKEILPYYDNYFNIVIPVLKSTMDNYLKSLNTNSELIHIMKLMI